MTPKLNLHNEFISKFKIQELLLREVDGWLISLRPHQPTIGSMILMLNRPCERMSGLTHQEGISLTVAFKEIEDLLAKTFNPQKINYLALMMVDQQVHFHVIPRYRDPIVVGGLQYIDAAWPGPPSLEPLTLKEEHVSVIYRTLKAHC